jgi:hypothetical protein
VLTCFSTVVASDHRPPGGGDVVVDSRLGAAADPQVAGLWVVARLAVARRIHVRRMERRSAVGVAWDRKPPEAQP